MKIVAVGEQTLYRLTREIVMGSMNLSESQFDQREQAIFNTPLAP